MVGYRIDDQHSIAKRARRPKGLTQGLCAPCHDLLSNEPYLEGRLRGHVRTTLGEVLLSKASVLLLGGLAIGWISGSTRIEPVMPLFKGLFHGVLLLYLLDLGATAAQGIAPVRRSLGRS